MTQRRKTGQPHKGWKDAAKERLRKAAAVQIDSFHITGPDDQNVVVEGGSRFVHERDVKKLMNIIRDRK